MKQTVEENLRKALDLHRQGKLDAAEALYEKARSADPRNSDTWHLLGLIAMNRGRLDAAKKLIKRAIKLNPADSAYHSNLGIVLKDLDEDIASLQSINRALELQRDYPEALNNRGLLHEKLGKFDEALSDFDHAIALRPTYFEALSNRGVTLQKMDRDDEALQSFRAAIAINPSFSDGFFNYAGLLRQLRRYEEAIKAFNAAAKADPTSPEILQGRGELYTDLGLTDLAMQDFESALAIRPGYPNALWAKGFTKLSTGDFNGGFKLFEYRFLQSKTPRPGYATTRPSWHPKMPRGRLLVWSEQGLGDEIFFVRWLKYANSLSSSVIAAVDPRMKPIYQRAFPLVEFIEKEPAPSSKMYDYHLPMGSLPNALTEVGVRWNDDISSPYLFADDNHIETIRRLLNVPDGCRTVGITWKSARPKLGQAKSINLESMIPIFKIPNRIFIDLQYGDTSTDIEELETRTGVKIRRIPNIDNKNDLPLHAALIANCDDLLLCCNASAHLAGALGKNATVLAPRGNSVLWYWTYRLERRPYWYPSIELFDQGDDLSWANAVESAIKNVHRKF